jgi:hypothetical protein
MKLVFHIVKKDLRRLRWWLLAWLVVLALPIFVGIALLVRNPFIVEGTHQGWDLAKVHERVLMFEVLVAYLLTLVLLQEDAVLGSRQFWLTRPIARGRLLAAKALGACVVLWLLPLAVSLPWWLWCGFGPREILVAGLELCAFATLIALPAALIAVLTDSLARAVLWTMVFAAVVAVTMLFFGVVTARPPSSPLWVSRPLLAVILVAFEFAGIVAVQFYVRRNGRWLIAAAVTILASLFAATRSPWVLVGQSDPEERNAEDASGVKVNFQSASFGPTPKVVDTPGGLDVRQWVGTRFVAEGVPAGTLLMGAGAAQRWRFGDAFELSSSGYLYGGGEHSVWIDGMKPVRWRDFPEDEETRGLIAAWKGRHKQAPSLSLLPPGRAQFSTDAQLRPSIVARMQTEPPHYEARVWMELARPELMIEAPIAAGQWHSGAGRRLKIDRIDSNVVSGTSWQGLTIQQLQLVATRPVPFIEMLRLHALNHVWFMQPWLQVRESYVALNRARGEFVPMDDRTDETKSRFDRELVVNGVLLQWISLQMMVPHIVRGEKWQPVPGWASGVTLGRVRARATATFARDIVVERFEFADGSK